MQTLAAFFHLLLHAPRLRRHLPGCCCSSRMPHAPFLPSRSYPEGHRSLLDEPLPLKTGMLKYAYSRRMPVQVR